MEIVYRISSKTITGAKGISKYYFKEYLGFGATREHATIFNDFEVAKQTALSEHFDLDCKMFVENVVDGTATEIFDNV